MFNVVTVLHDNDKEKNLVMLSTAKLARNITNKRIVMTPFL